MFDRGVPSICYSLRGLVYFQIDLRGTKSDLHSGVFGGAVANPAMVLAQILAQMKDRGGRIKIPGFYDDVRALSDEERAAWENAAVQREEVPQGSGRAEALRRDRIHDARARLGAADVRGERPALSGFTGEGAKTVIPAVAMAKVSMRLVPDQHPDKIAKLFEAYVQEGRAEDRRRQGHADARRQAVAHRVRQPVRAGGRPRDRSRASASRRCSAAKADRFRSSRRSRKSSASRRCSSVSGLPDENAHAPNERLDLGNFHNGIVASAILYDEIAGLR